MTDHYSDPMESKESTPMLSNSTYDTLKRLVTIGLPAFGTLYVTVAALWGLPNPEAVAGTVLAVSTFLGVLLNVAGRRYTAAEEETDGEIVVSEVDGVKKADLILKKYEDPADVVAQDKVTFTVRKA